MKKEINVALTISKPARNDGTEEISLRLQDRASGIEFVDASFPLDKFMLALTGLACQDGKAELRGLHKLGKKMEMGTLQFPMPPDVGYSGREEIARKLAEELCPEGWESQGYFGSQNSFYTKDGELWAQCTIRRWVEEEVNEQHVPD